MKHFKLYFFSPECGGIWQQTHVYAKNLKEAKSVVANKYYISPRRVFEA